MKAIVVQRDDATRRLLAELLARHGCDVVAVADAAAATKPGLPPPQLVLWDETRSADNFPSNVGRTADLASNEPGPMLVAVYSENVRPGERVPPGFDDVLAGPPDEHVWGLRLEAILRSAAAVEQERVRRRALENELASLHRLVALYENERQLSAFEIHDGLAQQLAAALMHLECFPDALQRDPDQAMREIALAADRMRQANAEARRLIGGLRPPLLDEQGLAPAVGLLVEQARGQIPQIELICRIGSVRLSPPWEHAAFRIVQEALSNATRHSHALRALVRIDQADGILAIEVRDWGIGFDPQRTRPSQYGLTGIRERARLLDGEASIESSPGNGTTVRVRLPFVI